MEFLQEERSIFSSYRVVDPVAIEREMNASYDPQLELERLEVQRRRDSRALANARAYYSPYTMRTPSPPPEVLRERALERQRQHGPGDDKIRPILTRVTQVFHVVDGVLNWIGALPSTLWNNPVTLAVRGFPRVIGEQYRAAKEAFAEQFDEVCIEHQSVDNLRMAWEDASLFRQEMREGTCFHSSLSCLIC